MSRTPTQGLDYTDKDYEAFRSMMLKDLQVKMPEYTDLRRSDAGVVLIELLAQGLDILSYYQDVVANEVFLVTEEQRNNVLKWCKMLSYNPRPSTPAKFKQVFILSSPQKTDTIIPQGTVVKTVGSSAENEIKFETMSDLKIPANKLGNEKDESGYLYAVDVVQGTSVQGELLGSSNGTPSQKFVLGYTPVILESIEVYVNEGNGFEKWVYVDNFVESSPTSKHFTVSLDSKDEATIVFGNGVFGKIPSRINDGIYCDYRIGGGTDGNVGAFKIKVLDSNISVVKETFNPDTAFKLGQDKETIDEIKVNAPVANRTLWGALTLEDFASVVEMNFPEVTYAISDRDLSNIDNIHIYVLLENNAPLTQSFKEKILELFDINKGGRKIVGADTIYIEPATLVPLTLEGSLIVKEEYSKTKVEQQIKDFVTNYFAIGNYPFHKELSLSELSASIMSPENAIAGIKAFKFISPAEDILSPKVNEIYTLETLTLNTTGGV